MLLGEEKGPRFGSFVALYGIDNTRALIGRAVKGELVNSAKFQSLKLLIIGEELSEQPDLRHTVARTRPVTSRGAPSGSVVKTSTSARLAGFRSTPIEPGNLLIPQPTSSVRMHSLRPA